MAAENRVWTSKRDCLHVFFWLCCFCNLIRCFPDWQWLFSLFMLHARHTLQITAHVATNSKSKLPSRLQNTGRNIWNRKHNPRLPNACVCQCTFFLLPASVCTTLQLLPAGRRNFAIHFHLGFCFSAQAARFCINCDLFTTHAKDACIRPML